MIAATEIRLVLVTPETTLLDQNVRSVQLPLFDGSMGFCPVVPRWSVAWDGAR
jgi:F-type H+-transporting ATPase subunit epsilon